MCYVTVLFLSRSTIPTPFRRVTRLIGRVHLHGHYNVTVWSVHTPCTLHTRRATRADTNGARPSVSRRVRCHNRRDGLQHRCPNSGPIRRNVVATALDGINDFSTPHAGSHRSRVLDYGSRARITYKIDRNSSSGAFYQEWPLLSPGRNVMRRWWMLMW